MTHEKFVENSIDISPTHPDRTVGAKTYHFRP